MLYLFTEPPGGWRTETQAAKLEASSGDLLGPAAIDGRNVFAFDTPPGGGQGFIDLFSEPARGWAGTVGESGRLVLPAAPEETRVYSVSASGGTVIASWGGVIYVFTEPAGGWSGTVNPVARLQPADASGLGFAALSGQTVVALGQSAEYVFTRPAGGWSGTVREAAELHSARPAPFPGVSVAISGGTVVADAGAGTAYVFSEPHSGWQGSLTPSATLSYPVPAYGTGPTVAISGRSIALADFDTHYPCPCSGGAWSYIEPPAGWSGFRQPYASAATEVDGYIAPAVSGSYVFVAESDGVHILKSVGAPSASRGYLNGLLRGAPGLGFVLTSGANAALIKSLTVELPRGLRFASARALRKNVRVSRPHRMKLTHGSLVVTLTRLASRISISVRSPALRESHALGQHVRRHHVKKLTFEIAVTDASGGTTRVVLRIST